MPYKSKEEAQKYQLEYNNAHKEERRKYAILYAKRRKLENPEHVKKLEQKQKLKYRYGISFEDYHRFLDLQNGVCAVCKNPPNKRSLDVDHNHITGKIRGLLCNDCNVALGRVKESIQILNSLIVYLQTKE